MADVTNGELARWLTRVETKLDKVGNDHEGRIRRTERIMWVAIGLALAGGATGIGSLVGTLVG
jgi:hypothetical protein